MTKMFKSVTQTWNPLTGCLHDCSYCWARGNANGRLKNRYLENHDICDPAALPYRMQFGDVSPDGYDTYADPFYPRRWSGRMKQHFKAGGLVFVCSMSDLMGMWWPQAWVMEALDNIKRNSQTDFLICTKNPERFGEFVFPSNVILASTLETNRETWDYSWAPEPALRQRFLAAANHPRKAISIEPVMDFDLPVMTEWVKEIKPELVEVGADNYSYHLPEPAKSKTTALLEVLRAIVPRVVEKDGLERLLK